MSAEQSVWAVIVAAGAGRRMQSDRPKQYLSFQGKTVLEHCLDRVLSHPRIDGAVLVLSPDDEHWPGLAYAAARPLHLASGGAERRDSVYSGLETLQRHCDGGTLALIHDAVRPLVSHADITNVVASAQRHPGGAILASPLTDTLKMQGEADLIANTVPREGLWCAQTPQVFRLSLLFGALSRAIETGQAITDDAEALELAGYAPALVASLTPNLKITSPGDLALAESIWLHQRDQDQHE